MKSLPQPSEPQNDNALAAYAAEMAATPLDLDSDLESAGIGHLIKTINIPAQN